MMNTLHQNSDPEFASGVLYTCLDSSFYCLCPTLDSKENKMSKRNKIPKDRDWVNGVFSRCNLCNRNLHWRKAVERHMIQNHNFNLLYVCPHCKIEFTRFVETKRHMSLKHRDFNYTTIEMSEVTIVRDDSIKRGKDESQETAVLSDESDKESITVDDENTETENLLTNNQMKGSDFCAGIASGEDEEIMVKEFTVNERITFDQETTFQKSAKVDFKTMSVSKDILEGKCGCQCGICGAVFAWRKCLHRHLQAYHHMTLMFRCRWCSKIYFKFRDAFIHIYSIHNDGDMPDSKSILLLGVKDEEGHGIDHAQDTSISRIVQNKNVNGKVINKDADQNKRLICVPVTYANTPDKSMTVSFDVSDSSFAGNSESEYSSFSGRNEDKNNTEPEMNLSEAFQARKFIKNKTRLSSTPVDDWDRGLTCQCNVSGCTRVFSWRKSLMRHMKDVHNTKLFLSCKKCTNSQFEALSLLKKHIHRVHGNVKNFEVGFVNAIVIGRGNTEALELYARERENITTCEAHRIYLLQYMMKSIPVTFEDIFHAGYYKTKFVDFFPTFQHLQQDSR